MDRVNTFSKKRSCNEENELKVLMLKNSGDVLSWRSTQESADHYHFNTKQVRSNCDILHNLSCTCPTHHVAFVCSPKRTSKLTYFRFCYVIKRDFLSFENVRIFHIAFNFLFLLSNYVLLLFRRIRPFLSWKQHESTR